MRRLMGEAETFPFFPVERSVSLSISSRISLKLKNFLPGTCRNSPHSSGFSPVSTLDFCNGETGFSPRSSFVAFSPFSVVFENAATPPTSPVELGLLMSWRTSGRRVTIPLPVVNRVNL
jgi:hypothetical protein